MESINSTIQVPSTFINIYVNKKNIIKMGWKEESTDEETNNLIYFGDYSLKIIVFLIALSENKLEPKR